MSERPYVIDETITKQLCQGRGALQNIQNEFVGTDKLIVGFAGEFIRIYCRLGA